MDDAQSWREFANTGLAGAVAKAVGARAHVSPELLGHFVRAGGGSVDRATELYLAVADEFVELREMARSGIFMARV